MSLPKEKIKLLCVDLDGTLLGFHNHIAPSSVDALNRLAMINDAEIIIFTGRALFSVRAIVKKLNAQLVRPIRYAVCFNGALIFDFVEENILDESFISAEVSQKIFEICNEKKLIFWGYPRFLPDRKTYVLVNKIFHTRLMSCFKRKMIRYTNSCRKFEFQKILIFGRKHFFDKTELFKKELVDQLEICPIAMNALEITTKDTTKGKGVAFFKKKLNLEKSQISSIGNSMNDLPMFLASGYNIAMARSPINLIKHAQMLTSKNKRTAFGEAIEKLIAYS